MLTGKRVMLGHLGLQFVINLLLIVLKDEILRSHFLIKFSNYGSVATACSFTCPAHLHVFQAHVPFCMYSIS